MGRLSSGQLERVLQRLDNVRQTSTGFQARCPAHNDRVSSLSIKESETGRILLYCHAGCSFKSIVDKAGIKMEREDVRNRELVATYDYTDESGKLLYQVLRYNPKAFQQRHMGSNGEWVWNREGCRPVLYRLKSILQAKELGKIVFFVEGEKDVDNLVGLGLTATTMTGGASSKWLPEYTEQLSGAKVIIIPDNDDPGRKYAQTVAEALYGFAASLHILNLNVEAHGDVSDWITDNGGNDMPREDFANMVNQGIKPYTPPVQVTRAEMDSLVRYVKHLECSINRNILREVKDGE